MKITKAHFKHIIKEEILKELRVMERRRRRRRKRDKGWVGTSLPFMSRKQAEKNNPDLMEDTISMEERRALKLLRDTVAFKKAVVDTGVKWLPEIMDALEKSLGFQIFYLYHNDAFIETILNTMKIIQNAPEIAPPELLKLVAKDGKIVDTPPEPPVGIPEDPDELKALAIKTVVDQLDKIGRPIFSNEMHAGAIFKKKTDDEERSFWQRRKQYDADTDYISDHKGESPFKELWQQLNVQAALD